MKKVLLGMSGGIDSTYAVHLLKEKGYCVEGAVLVMHEYTELSEAQEAARGMDIPLHVIHAEDAFDTLVVKEFCETYQKAETPNPCIICNERVKMRLLYEEAMRLGFDAIATGHYARVVRVGERYAIGEAKDSRKDQSYMLYRLPQHVLARLLLPLGDCVKSDIVFCNISLHLCRESVRKFCNIPCTVKKEASARNKILYHVIFVNV